MSKQTIFTKEHIDKIIRAFQLEGGYRKGCWTIYDPNEVYLGDIGTFCETDSLDVLINLLVEYKEKQASLRAEVETKAKLRAFLGIDEYIEERISRIKLIGGY